jgi:hypothetical protein
MRSKLAIPSSPQATASPSDLAKQALCGYPVREVRNPFES